MKNCKKETICTLYKRSNGSDGVTCTINLFREITSISPSFYRVAAGDTIKYDIGRIRYLRCICKKYDFSQEPGINFSKLGKADVNIEGFYKVPQLKETYLIASPNNTLHVTKNSRTQYQVSASDLCQTYNLTLTVESLPTCTNWKIKSNVTFPLEINDTNILSCHYNYTTTMISISAENDSRVYYILKFEYEQFKRNVTKELTVPTKLMKIEFKTNITAFIKLCAYGCDKCGKEKEFICYSTIQNTFKNGKTSIRDAVAILCKLGGLIFLTIFGIILRFKYRKTSKSCNSDKDEIRPRHTPESFSRILIEKDEDYAGENDPTYEKINECHHYDKPDISFKDKDSVSKKPW